MRSMPMKSIKAVCLASLIGLSGCGLSKTPDVTVVMKSATEAPQSTSSESEPMETGTGETTPAKSPAEAGGGFGDLIGKVELTGEIPMLPPLVAQGANVPDKATCSAMEVPSEVIVVDPATLGIHNVFIYLEKAPAGAPVVPPPAEQVFDQKGCRFLPHAMIVRAKVPLKVLSDDDVAHNTHTFPNRNATFNSVIGKKERKGVILTYTQSEKEPIEVKCDYHPWMKAYHLPMDHGYAALTNEKGEFTIKGLPAGQYNFKVWHEAVGLLERSYKVEIKAGENTAPPLKYPASKFSN